MISTASISLTFLSPYTGSTGLPVMVPALHFFACIILVGHVLLLRVHMPLHTCPCISIIPSMFHIPLLCFASSLFWHYCTFWCFYSPARKKGKQRTLQYPAAKLWAVPLTRTLIPDNAQLRFTEMIFYRMLEGKHDSGDHRCLFFQRG